MTLSLIILGASLAAMAAMVALKAMAIAGRPVAFVTKASQKAEEKTVVVIEKASKRFRAWRTALLLKFHDFVYDSFIPWTQRRYRWLASAVYRIHRKLWSLMEYSKQSSHKVSEYLRHISHKEQQEDKPL